MVCLKHTKMEKKNKQKHDENVNVCGPERVIAK